MLQVVSGSAWQFFVHQQAFSLGNAHVSVSRFVCVLTRGWRSWSSEPS